MDKNDSIFGLIFCTFVLICKWIVEKQPEYHPVDDNDTQGEL